MTKYDFIGSASKNIFCIKGVNVFKYNWTNTGRCAVILNPKTKKPFTFSIYEISLSDNTVIAFAAGKFSDDEWSFFVQQE